MLGRDKLDKLVEGGVEIVESENTETAFVGTAMLIVEIRDTNGMTAWYTFCTDKREWVQRAVVREAEMAVDFSDVMEGEADGD